MPRDPKDFLVTGALSVDTDRFRTYVHSAVVQARTDVSAGITLAVDAGMTARAFLSPSLMGTAPITSAYQDSAFSSLAALREPYDSLASITALTPYAGTLNTLAVAGSIGAGVRDLYASVSSNALLNVGPLATTHVSPLATTNVSPLAITHIGPLAITSVGPPAITNVSPLSITNGRVMATLPGTLGALMTGALSVAAPESLFAVKNIASPYLASMSAVHSLETSFARLSEALRVGAPTPAGYVLGMMSPGVTTLRESVVEMSGALRSTWDEIRGDSARLSGSAISVLRAPAVELYAAAQAAASVSLRPDEQPDIDEEIEEILDDAVDNFESRLAAVDQAFVTIYRGGVAAIKRGGPDWQRHCMVSFRELSTHVLHVLAPDEKILPSATRGDLHDGRPTRRARLNYIFASVTGSAIASFYEADMKAALSLFDLLNDGTHKLASTATPEQVHYLKSRLAGLVNAMLSARGF